MPLFGKKKDKSSGILKNYEKVINEGFEASQRGDAEKAVFNFRKVLRWVSEDIDKVSKLSDSDKKKLSELLTSAGEEMINLKEFDAAIKLLEKAKTIDPKNFRAWMDIGKDLLQRNTQVPYALVCLREAAKLEPENIEAHLLLGDAYRIQGQLDKALAAYQKALKVDPENEDALQKVLKIQPENIDILEKYIKVLEAKGDKEELIKAYNRMVTITGDRDYLEKGLQFDPENKDLLMNKARILLKEEKVDEAKEIVNKLKEMYPDDADISMLYDELNPKEEEASVEEEVPSVEVGELFEDISLGEAPETSFEDEGTMQIAGSEEGEKENLPEIPTIGGAVTSGAVGSAMEEKKIETPEIKEQEVPEKEEPIKEEEEIAPPAEPEEKIEAPPEEPKEEKLEEMKMGEEIVPEKKEIIIPPEEMFLQDYEIGRFDDSAKLLEGMRDEDIMKLLSENVKILKFVYENLVKQGRRELALKFIDKIIEKEDTEENKLEKSRLLIDMGQMDEAESILNDIVKKNMKNGKALYLKARIQSIKGNDMGARNFLMMATKFNPELKEEAKNDPFLEKYRDKEWFKKITS